MKRKGILLFCGVVLWCLFFPFSVAFCQEDAAGVVEDSFNSTEALIDLLREKGVISDDEAASFIQRHRDGASVEKQSGKVITIIPEEKEDVYIQRITEEVAKEITEDVQAKVKGEIKDELAEEIRLARQIPTAAAWTKRIRWGGDIRLRYQGQFYDKDNFPEFSKPDEPGELLNSTEDRHRFRYRVRLKVKAEVNEKLEFGARLVAGNEENPVSINETFGDYFTNDNVVFDQVYLRWHPVPEVSLWGGRIPNPWFHSDLVWDPDLNFEGVALNWDTLLAGDWRGFLNAGVFPLQEVEFAQRDKWLFGGQIGTTWEPGEKLSAQLGVAYYDYYHVEGEVNDPLRPNEKDWTAPLYQQKGNTLIDIDPSLDRKLALASDYDLLNITGKLDLGFFDPVHVLLLGDYVVNVGFDKEEAASKTDDPDAQEAILDKEKTQGYQVGLTVGHPKVRRLWAWNVFLRYKYLEADAVLDAFTESDFHLGGTDAKGWILGGELGLADDLWLRTRWLTADEIDGPPLAIDVLQVDLRAEY